MTIEIKSLYPATPIPSSVVIDDNTNGKLIIQNVGAILISCDGALMLETQKDLAELINVLKTMLVIDNE